MFAGMINVSRGITIAILITTLILNIQLPVLAQQTEKATIVIKLTSANNVPLKGFEVRFFENGTQIDRIEDQFTGIVNWTKAEIGKTYRVKTYYREILVNSTTISVEGQSKDITLVANINVYNFTIRTQKPLTINITITSPKNHTTNQIKIINSHTFINHQEGLYILTTKNPHIIIYPQLINLENNDSTFYLITANFTEIINSSQKLNFQMNKLNEDLSYLNQTIKGEVYFLKGRIDNLNRTLREGLLKVQPSIDNFVSYAALTLSVISLIISLVILIIVLRQTRLVTSGQAHFHADTIAE